MGFRSCIVVLVLLAALGLNRAAFARPQIIFGDVKDPASSPDRFGYHVSAERRGPDVRFTVRIDREAGARLHEAQLFSLVPEHANRTLLPTQGRGGEKILRFALPTAQLQKIMLQLQSDPLRAEDAIPDFFAYRIRLDNVATP